MDYKADYIYREALKTLSFNKVEFVVIGTYGLWLRLKGQRFSFEINDCDIIIKNEPENIQRFATAMLNLLWKVEVWGETISLPIENSLLNGKIYLRARRKDLIIDATYECEYIPWLELFENSSMFGGIPVACFEHIFKLKRIRGTEVDFKVIEEIQRMLMGEI
jgi:hypothetical protein